MTCIVWNRTPAVQRYVPFNHFAHVFTFQTQHGNLEKAKQKAQWFVTVLLWPPMMQKTGTFFTPAHIPPLESVKTFCLTVVWTVIIIHAHWCDYWEFVLFLFLSQHCLHKPQMQHHRHIAISHLISNFKRCADYIFLHTAVKTAFAHTELWKEFSCTWLHE